MSSASPAHAYEVDQKHNTVELKSLADFDKCNAELDSEVCLAGLKVLTAKRPQDALEAGKRVRLNFNHWAALPFFDQALAKRATPAQCADEDVWLAVSSGLALPASDPNEALAAKIGAERCWAQLQSKLPAELGDGGYYRDNVCGIFKSKSVDHAACKPAAAQAPAPKASNDLARLAATDWTKLTMDPGSAVMLRGQGDERVLMVQTGQKQDNLYLVKFKGIKGPLNDKTLLTKETVGGSGKNYVASVGNQEWVVLTQRDGFYEAYPKEHPDSMPVYRAG